MRLNSSGGTAPNATRLKALMVGYSERIRDYAAREDHVGKIEHPDGCGEVGLGPEEAGRQVAVRFTVACDGEMLRQVRFQVFGCGFTIAACAAAAELAEGISLAEARVLTAAMVDTRLEGLPSERSYCADLAASALQAALTSLENGAPQAVQVAVPEEEHGPRISAATPLYATLFASTVPDGVDPLDRHLFACLLAVAAEESEAVNLPLGLSPEDIEAIRATYFPALAPEVLSTAPAEENSEELLTLVEQHLPVAEDGTIPAASRWLARALVARSAQPGHLWVAMGLFHRPELTAAIRRHLPALAAANHRNMRWKRYLFKQLCDLQGGRLCKAPNCGVCSDYAVCFAPEDEDV